MILASVIGEKALEKCSTLFCYLDAIGEAMRLDTTNSLGRVRRFLPTYHPNIGLWLKVTAPVRTVQPLGGQDNLASPRLFRGDFASP